MLRCINLWFLSGRRFRKQELFFFIRVQHIGMAVIKAILIMHQKLKSCGNSCECHSLQIIQYGSQHPPLVTSFCTTYQSLANAHASVGQLDPRHNSSFTTVHGFYHTRDSNQVPQAHPLFQILICAHSSSNLVKTKQVSPQQVSQDINVVLLVIFQPFEFTAALLVENQILACTMHSHKQRSNWSLTSFQNFVLFFQCVCFEQLLHRLICLALRAYPTNPSCLY